MYDNIQYLTQQTINKCSNVLGTKNGIEIDEKIKARIYSRLVREYRRTLEFHQQLMIAEQKNREIENNMRQRFPNLMNNDNYQ